MRFHVYISASYENDAKNNDFVVNDIVEIINKPLNQLMNSLICLNNEIIITINIFI